MICVFQGKEAALVFVEAALAEKTPKIKIINNEIKTALHVFIFNLRFHLGKSL